MRKTALTAAGLLLGASLLAGCGGDDDKKTTGSTGDNGDGGGNNSSSSYCDNLEETASMLKTLSGGSATPDFDDFNEFIGRAQDIADSAPDEVKSDWEKVAGLLEDLSNALQDAGISFDDLGAMASGKMPEGLTEAELDALSKELQKLDDPAVDEASESIEKHAKDECDVDLNAG